MLLLNDIPVDYCKFSDGDLHIKIPPEFKHERAILTWKPNHTDHILQLGLTVNALQKAGVMDIDLDVLYLPYGRQDRVCNPGEPYSLELICTFLDNLKVCNIRIWDMHSSQNIEDLFPHTAVWEVEAFDIFNRFKLLDSFDLDRVLLCAPDNGAYSRVDQIANYSECQTPVFLSKKRNSETGYIESIELDRYSRSPEGYSILIVDDICDGGATFLKAAELLKSLGAENLYLYVTHGIFSKGLSELNKVFKHIYCHHVLHDCEYQSNENLTILRSFPSGYEPIACN